MRAVGAFFLAISLSLLIARPALAEKRVALVIGNSGYQHVARLDNPANDASAMTEVLKGAGFDLVETFHDLKTSEMRRVLRDFSDHARDADVAVVYYAGHGIEVDGTNYLIPVDAALERDIDVYDEAFALDRILVTIEPAKQLRLVILDACRDNPFAKTMKRTNGARAVGRGLAKVEPNSPNTLIAFASKAGSTALDGDSKHSPFTAALVKYIGTPGLDLRKAFGFVRDDVLKNTGNRQEPYVYGSLGGDDLPLVPAKSAAVAPPADPNAEVRRDYELALQIGTREVWTAFLAQYPEGLYASLAKGQLDKIASEKQSGQAKVATAEQGSAVPDKDVAGKISSDAARPNPQVASLPATDDPAAKANLSAAEIVRSMQTELRRVGCLTAAEDGEWTSSSRHALELFNRQAGTKFDVKVASLDALDAVKATPARICPLICQHGFKRDGEGCIRIACRRGYEVGDGNNCEKIEVKRKELKAERDRPERIRSASEPAKPDTTETPQQKFENSPTCSNVNAACEKAVTKFGFGTHCPARFAECMRTGKWRSNVSYYEGLARR